MINQKQEDDAMKSKKAKAATKRGVVSAPVCSALNKPWVVAEAGAKYFIDADGEESQSDMNRHAKT